MLAESKVVVCCRNVISCWRTRKVMNYAESDDDTSSTSDGNAIEKKLPKRTAQTAKSTRLSKMKPGSTKKRKLSTKSSVIEPKLIPNQSSKVWIIYFFYSKYHILLLPCFSCQFHLQLLWHQRERKGLLCPKQNLMRKDIEFRHKTLLSQKRVFVLSRID